MKKLRDERVIKDSKVEYRADDPIRPLVLTPIKRTQDQYPDHEADIMRREAKYILGYTGTVPS